MIFQRKMNSIPKPIPYVIILLVLWAMVQTLIFHLYGIKSAVDTTFYLEDAALIRQGIWPTGRGLMYISYSMLLAVIQVIGLSVSWIILIQIAASLFATIAIFRLATDLYKNKYAGVFAVVFYLLWIKIHQWNFILYTDSLFASLTIISLTLFYFSKKRRDYIVASIVLLFAIFIRPNGVGLIIAMGGFLMVKFYFDEKRVLKNSFLGISVVLIAIVINHLFEAHIDSFLDSYAKAEVIYPGRQLFLSPPHDLVIPNGDSPALLQLAAFIIYNPVYFGKLFLLKALLFLANVKPYFSWVHNFIIIVVLYPIYYLAVLGYRRLNDRAVKTFVSLFIGLQIGIVGLTSENWDGRFLIPLLPLIFVLAAGELSVIAKKVFHGSNER
ncbi:MAG: hypothetical protein ABJH98_19455 [Reichenbachiella sp.]|uniref:hypothetical protein n=1 Tax=Reichenbachiella sp. TaxID=2184521 RepID=UPI0032983D65